MASMRISVSLKMPPNPSYPKINLNTEHQTPNTKHYTPNTKHQTLNTKH